MENELYDNRENTYELHLIPVAYLRGVCAIRMLGQREKFIFIEKKYGCDNPEGLPRWYTG